MTIKSINKTFVLNRHLRGLGSVVVLSLEGTLAIVRDLQTGQQYPAAQKDLKDPFSLSNENRRLLGFIR